ncbi:MAG: DUF86 domain-containing protein [Candidatus Sumerlaeota bacterium]
MRHDQERLADIIEAIEKIEERKPDSFEHFHSDEAHLVWAVYHIQNIGEAAARLSVDLRYETQEIPWADIIAMRNILVHHYFGIDPREVWDTIQTDLPELKTEISRLVK